MPDLRTRQREMGRQAIVDACAALVTERHHLDFSMKEVADRAGVSLRTVYNHFATREDLLDALGEIVDERSRALGQEQAQDLETMDDLHRAVTTNMAVFEKLGGISEAFAQLPLANVGRDTDRAARTRIVTEFIAAQMQGAPPDDARAIAVVLRHLLSHRSWYWLTHEYGLSTAPGVPDRELGHRHLDRRGIRRATSRTRGGIMITTSTTVGLLDLGDPRACDPAVAGAKGGPRPIAGRGIRRPRRRDPAAGSPRRGRRARRRPAALVEAVTDWCGQVDGPLAVRTSATWEDGATSAHAGATETVLDVTGPAATIAAVRQCLDASARAAAEHGATGEIAVVLQRLVRADWAGWPSRPTRSPASATSCASPPRRASVRHSCREVIGADVTVRHDRVEGDLAGLPESVAVEVAAAARRVESAFGTPQDIEWAVEAGVLWLVQARPITVLPIEPTLPEGNNWQKDTAHFPSR
ncbi:MAG: PEP/pyruvate-binding domain-containing protein [Acidimicrobiales bacterium]